MQKKLLLVIALCATTIFGKAQINLNIFINGTKSGAYTVKVDVVAATVVRHPKQKYNHKNV